MGRLKGYRAVVTGASSGIGLEMARILAHWGCDLVLTARRADRLEQLAGELRQQHGIDVQCVPVDLATAAGPAQLASAASAENREVDILINNAGFGTYQRFADIPWPRSDMLLRLNITALTELTHRFLGPMLGRNKRCYIVNVASIVSYWPFTFFSTYAASKSYVRQFSECLAAELADTNVSVTCVCPGSTVTEFSDVAEQDLPESAKGMMMSATRCARIGLRAMLRRRRNVITGASNKIFAFLAWLLPHRFATWVVRKIMGEPTPAVPAGNTRSSDG